MITYLLDGPGEAPVIVVVLVAAAVLVSGFVVMGRRLRGERPDPLPAPVPAGAA